MDRSDDFLLVLDGSLVTSCSYLGVQYLGERRVFRVVGVTEFGDKSEAANHVGELQLNLSQLDLNGSDAVQSDSNSSYEEFDIYKITSRSKFRIIAEPSEDECDGSPQQRPLGFSEVGGLQKQIELLKELVLHPLKVLTNKGIAPSCKP